MSDINPINENSSKEEVAEYLSKKLKFKEEDTQKFIKEDISGDVLYDLEENDLKNFGLKVGPLKKLKTFVKEFKEKFGEKFEANKIDEKITKNSSSEEVTAFFKKCLNFSGNLNNMDGKGLLEMNDEDINKLGLNLGQKKKIKRFINYFKSLKIEEPENMNIKITKESNAEEVAKFLKKILKFSDQAISELELEGETLLTLEESDFEENEVLTEDEKKRLKNFLKEQNTPIKKDEKMNIEKETLNIKDKEKKEDNKQSENKTKENNGIEESNIDLIKNDDKKENEKMRGDTKSKELGSDEKKDNCEKEKMNVKPKFKEKKILKQMNGKRYKKKNQLFIDD